MKLYALNDDTVECDGCYEDADYGPADEQDKLVMAILETGQCATCGRVRALNFLIQAENAGAFDLPTGEPPFRDIIVTKISTKEDSHGI